MLKTLFFVAHFRKLALHNLVITVITKSNHYLLRLLDMFVRHVIIASMLVPTPRAKPTVLVLVLVYFSTTSFSDLFCKHSSQ